MAIVTTHPIQYNAPLFKELAKVVDLKVFYTWSQANGTIYDPGFDTERKWDVPLLDGYVFEFIENIAKAPGSHHFKGIDNPTLIKKIGEFSPEAILIFGWSFKSHLKLIRCFSKSGKIIFRGDSTLLDESQGISLKKILRRIFLTWVYTHIDVALYTGTANKAYFTKHGVGQKKMVFAPHSIDNGRYSPNDANRLAASKMRDQLSIKASDLVYLFAAKLEKKKDPLLLTNAFKRVGHPNVHLVIVGSGELEQAARMATANNRRVHFLPFQNQSIMPVIYALADVFILPSKGPGETWGLAVNEAMASGKAVIVSDKCGCAQDLVHNGENGFIFESGSENDLLEKMNLIENKGFAEKMGRISLKIIEDWNYNAVCLAIQHILNQ